MTRLTTRLSARLGGRLFIATLPLLMTAAAFAQNQGPRNPKVDTAANPAIGYGIIAVLCGAVLAISLYPSKRAHTDL
jgi:hypothetical protein